MTKWHFCEIGQTLQTHISLNIHHSSIKVIYLEPGKQGLQHEIEIPFCDEKFSNIFYISKTLSGCSSLNIGSVWKTLYIWNQESLIYNMGVEFLSDMFHFRPDWSPLVDYYACCMEIPRTSNGGKSARHCLFVPARNC